MKSGLSKLGKSIVMLSCKILLTAIVAAVFYIVYLYSGYYNSATFFSKGNVAMLFLYLFLYYTFMTVYGGYKIGISRLRELALGHAITLLFVNFITYVVMSLISEKLVYVLPLLIVMIAQWSLGVFVYIISILLNDKFYPSKDAVMISVDMERDKAIAAKLSGHATRYRIHEFIDADTPDEELFSRLDNYKTVVLSHIDGSKRNAVMDYCFRTGKTTFIVPTVNDILLNNATRYSIGDIFFYKATYRGISPGLALIKRIADIIFSLIMLIIASPFMLISALIIKLQDKGPVFYKQKRLTLNGREFNVLKFRSMVVDAEKKTGAILSTKNDPRITPFGKFIRATRIDELPQLINILKGDMTLVGPRPERPEMYAEICKTCPEFAYRLKVKAGLTGYAQLYGKYNTSAADKLNLDLLYIQNASVVLDLQLLFYTLKIIFMRESTEGADNPADTNKAQDTKQTDNAEN